jgi:hypothetical protein
MLRATIEAGMAMRVIRNRSGKAMVDGFGQAG